jgi:hypothetical protein
MGQSSSSMLQPPSSRNPSTASGSGAKEVNPNTPHTESAGASGSGAKMDRPNHPHTDSDGTSSSKAS